MISQYCSWTCWHLMLKLLSLSLIYLYSKGKSLWKLPNEIVAHATIQVAHWKMYGKNWNYYLSKVILKSFFTSILPVLLNKARPSRPSLRLCQDLSQGRGNRGRRFCRRGRDQASRPNITVFYKTSYTKYTKSLFTSVFFLIIVFLYFQKYVWKVFLFSYFQHTLFKYEG